MLFIPFGISACDKFTIKKLVCWLLKRIWGEMREINQIQSLTGQSLLEPAIILSPAVIIENLALKLKMASTLEDIAELFATKTTNLKRCVEIRSAGRVN